MTIRLNKNESPYRALKPEEIAQIAIDTQYNRYAVDENARLIYAYANFRSINPETIALANGSDEWIQKLMILFGGKGPVLTVQPDFNMYEIYATQLNCDVIEVICNEDFTFDYNKIFETIRREKPSIFIFSQPNNPFGYLHPTEFIEQASELMKEVGGYLVIDEAYGEFAEPMPVYPEENHIIYLRTLSKAFGLAGLRIGVAQTTSKTLELLTSIDHPYPVNTLSLNLASYLLEQPERTAEFIQLNQSLSNRLVELFETEVGDTVAILPTKTNFLFTYGEAAVSLGEWVKEHDFIIRTYESESNPALHQAVRYSIGSEEEMEQLRQVLQDWRVKNGY